MMEILEEEIIISMGLARSNQAGPISAATTLSQTDALDPPHIFNPFPVVEGAAGASARHPAARAGAAEIRHSGGAMRTDAFFWRARFKISTPVARSSSAIPRLNTRDALILARLRRPLPAISVWSRQLRIDARDADKLALVQPGIVHLPAVVGEHEIGLPR